MVKQFNIDIDENLKKEAKKYAIENNTTLTKMITDYLTSVISENTRTKNFNPLNLRTQRIDANLRVDTISTSTNINLSWDIPKISDALKNLTTIKELAEYEQKGKSIMNIAKRLKDEKIINDKAIARLDSYKKQEITINI